MFGMKVGKLSVFVCLCAFALPAVAGVNVSSPGNGATVTSPVHFAATASSACSKGVAAVGIYTAPYVLAYKVNGSSLNTNLSMSSGTQYPVVQEWDNCGSSSKVQLKVTVDPSSVNNSSGTGKVFSSLQKSGGWKGYALLPPGFGICSDCTPTGSRVKWSWTQGVGSPSMDGISTKSAYNGGTTQW